MPVLPAVPAPGAVLSAPPVDGFVRPGGVPLVVPSFWIQPPIGVTGPVGLVTGEVARRV